MRIQYLGHSAFRLISEMGTSVICDPYDKKLVGYEMPFLRSDIVTASHSHSDHNFFKGISGNPSILDCECSVLADDISISSFTCFHDKEKGKKRGKNLVFKFLIDGISVSHMGDIGEVSDEVIEQLCGTDILLLPVGGVYTIDATEAKKYVNAIKPKIVIPMHYAQADGTINIDGVEKFLQLFLPATVERYAFDTLVISDEPQNESLRVLVLPRFED